MSAKCSPQNTLHPCQAKMAGIQGPWRNHNAISPPSICLEK